MDRWPTAIQDSVRAAIRQVLSDEADWPLVLLGQVGTGKTCAALCLLDYAGGRYYTAGDLAAKVIEAQQGRLWAEGNPGQTGLQVWPNVLWDGIARTPLVVLDEIGARERVSDHQYDVVKTCIDRRLGKPFVAISNLSLAEIGRLYDQRIASRLAAGTVIEMQGEDRRLIQRKDSP